jgi:hypothetical protein
MHCATLSSVDILCLTPISIEHHFYVAHKYSTHITSTSLHYFKVKCIYTMHQYLFHALVFRWMPIFTEHDFAIVQQQHNTVCTSTYSNYIMSTLQMHITLFLLWHNIASFDVNLRYFFIVHLYYVHTTYYTQHSVKTQCIYPVHPYFLCNTKSSMHIPAKHILCTPKTPRSVLFSF